MATVYVGFELDRKMQRETAIAIFATEKLSKDWVEENDRDRRAQSYDVLTTLEDGRKARALAKLTKEDREALGVGEFESARRTPPAAKVRKAVPT